MYKFIVLVLLGLISPAAFSADGKGEITDVFFAGSGFGSHPNVVQFKIDGGFNRSGCNAVYAAVRSEDSHLVSAILSAKMSNSVIEVHLDANRRE